RGGGSGSLKGRDAAYLDGGGRERSPEGAPGPSRTVLTATTRGKTGGIAACALPGPLQAKAMPAAASAPPIHPAARGEAAWGAFGAESRGPGAGRHSSLRRMIAAECFRT